VIKRLMNLFNGQVLNRAAFTEAFIAELKRRSPNLEVQELADGSLSLKLGEASTKSFLDNAYHLYQLNPKALADIIDKYARGALDGFENQEATTRLEDVIPVFKDVDYVAGARSFLQKRGEDPSKFDMHALPYNDEIMLTFAEDGPNSTKYLSSDTVAGLGLDDGQLLPTALKHFRARFTPRLEPSDGLLRVVVDTNYDPTALLLEEFWRGLRAQYGELVVAAPARNALIACAVADAPAVERLRWMARDIHAESPYALVPTLFSWNGERWERYGEPA
jgi:hypothetical protein